MNIRGFGEIDGVPVVEGSPSDSLDRLIGNGRVRLRRAG